MLPSVSCTLTSFQNLLSFAVPPPFPSATALISWPFLSSSACFLFLATRISTCSALGVGAAGGGPDAVNAAGATVAGEGCVVWIHRWLNGAKLWPREIRRPFKPFTTGSWLMRFIFTKCLLRVRIAQKISRHWGWCGYAAACCIFAASRANISIFHSWHLGTKINCYLNRDSHDTHPLGVP